MTVDEDWYQKRREYLIEGAHYHSRALDTHILTLAAGVLAFTTVFIPADAKSVTCCTGTLLFGAWLLLLGSVCSMLVSLYLGRKDYDWEIKHLDEQHKKGEIETPSAKGPCRAWVTRLTTASLVLFCLGLLFLCLFGAARIVGPLLQR